MGRYNQNGQSHGHEIPLIKGSRMPKTILHLLEARQIKLCRLLDQTPLGQTPSKHTSRIHHAIHSGGNATTRTSNTRSSSVNRKKKKEKKEVSKSSKVKLLRGCDNPRLQEVLKPT
jgi:hypothetical protein